MTTSVELHHQGAGQPLGLRELPPEVVAVAGGGGEPAPDRLEPADLPRGVGIVGGRRADRQAFGARGPGDGAEVLGHGDILPPRCADGPRMRQGVRMHFVGVDLAWGERKPTGLAVLDDGGRLVHVSAAGSDEEIRAALAPYVEGDCLVAIDAPLIVRNATGNRPGRGRAQPRLRPLRRRRPPVQHRQAGVQRHPAGRPALRAARPRHEPALGARAPRDRGLPAPGDRGAVPARAGR